MGGENGQDHAHSARGEHRRRIEQVWLFSRESFGGINANQRAANEGISGLENRVN